jgi:hypothetical protein
MNNKDLKFLQKNYPDKGAKFCALALKKSIKSIRDSAFYYNIKFNVYHFNPIHFINVNNPEIAYLLGLLWGDGYLEQGPRNYRISIQGMKTDFEPLKQIFFRNASWRYYLKYLKNRKVQSMYRLSCKELFIYLAENGYQSKSNLSACKILSTIPKNLLNYWFRGLVDADGCFYINKKWKTTQFSCSSAINQDWTYFMKLFDKLNINYAIKKQIVQKVNKTHSSSMIRICSTPNIIKFGNYIYQNYPKDKIGFERKYNKFQEIVNYYKSRTQKQP